jgi:SOS-response transcriptional repressor LexA
MAPEKKKANRKGVVVNTTVSEEIHEALERYIADQTVEPKKTSVVQTALRDFFIHLGYMEGELSAAASGGVTLHHVGPVSAGTGLEVFDEATETVELGEQLGMRGKDYYVFEVRGDSMEEDRIFEGDQVVIRRDPEPQPGDDVIIRYDGKLMLKRLKIKTPTHIQVVSRDAKKKTYSLDPSRGDAILGKAVALMRTF